MLSFARFRPQTLETSPFKWAVLDDVFHDPQDAKILGHEFPSTGFTNITSTRQDKQYAARAASVESVKLSKAWERLVSLLRGADYCLAVENLTGLQLSHLARELTLWRYEAGDHLSPHVDKPEKVVTQVFYFSEQARDNDSAGCLEIRRDAGPEDIERVIAPRLGRVVTLVRSEQSWHAVRPHEQVGWSRLSLQVVFTDRLLRYTNDL